MSPRSVGRVVALAAISSLGGVTPPVYAQEATEQDNAEFDPEEGSEVITIVGQSGSSYRLTAELDGSEGQLVREGSPMTYFVPMNDETIPNAARLRLTYY
ncbi:MAG: hypothetical protein WA948_01520 [Pontixanthobacter sp.]